MIITPSVGLASAVTDSKRGSDRGPVFCPAGLANGRTGFCASKSAMRMVPRSGNKTSVSRCCDRSIFFSATRLVPALVPDRRLVQPEKPLDLLYHHRRLLSS